LPVDVFHEGLADILETRFLRLCIGRRKCAR